MTSSTMHGAMSRSFWRIGLGVHLAVVTAISIVAYLGLLPDASRILPRYDLPGHLVFIGVIAFFLDGALDFRPLLPGWPRLAWLRLAPVIVVGLAGIEELVQSFSPYRSPSILDFTCDTVGIVLFSWLARRLETRREAKRGRA